jgi:type II secretory pathway pseudopilin PulG
LVLEPYSSWLFNEHIYDNEDFGVESMKIAGTTTRKGRDGFTLVEVAISTAIAIVVVVGTMNVFISFLRSYNNTTLMRNTSTRASLALDRMVYGVSTNDGLREAIASSVLATYASGGWTLSYTNNDGTSYKYFQYTTNTLSITDQAGKNICTNVIASTAVVSFCTNGSGATATFSTNGCRISVTVSESAGGRSYTNNVSTFVQFRN